MPHRAHKRKLEDGGSASASSAHRSKLTATHHRREKRRKQQHPDSRPLPVPESVVLPVPSSSAQNRRNSNPTSIQSTAEPASRPTASRRQRRRRRQKAPLPRLSSSSEPIASKHDAPSSFEGRRAREPDLTSEISRTQLLRAPIKRWNEPNDNVTDLVGHEHVLGGDVLVQSTGDANPPTMRVESAEPLINRGKVSALSYDSGTALATTTDPAASSWFAQELPTRNGIRSTRSNVLASGLEPTRSTLPKASKPSRERTLLNLSAVSNGSNTITSRKHFDAFWKTDNTDDSDNESDDSTSGSDDGPAPPRTTTGSIRESFADQLHSVSESGNPAVESTTEARPPSGDAEEHPDVSRPGLDPSDDDDGTHDGDALHDDDAAQNDDAIHNGDANHDGDATHNDDAAHDGDDTHSEDEPQAPSATQTSDASGIGHRPLRASTRAANVRVKRTLLSGEAGGAPSGRGPEVSTPATSKRRESLKENSPALISPFHAFPSGDPEDSDDVFNNIDDISTVVFRSTRPLPKRKLTDFAGSRGKDKILTNRHSDRILRCRRTVQNTTDPGEDLDGSNTTIGHVQTDDGGETGSIGANSGLNVDHVARKSSPVSPDSMTKARDTKTRSRARKGATVNPTPQDDAVIAPETSIPKPPAAATKKKRKMTGITSKHFSPVKGVKRSKRNSLQEVNNIAQATVPSLADAAAAVAELLTPSENANSEILGSQRQTRSSATKHSTRAPEPVSDQSVDVVQPSQPTGEPGPQDSPRERTELSHHADGDNLEPDEARPIARASTKARPTKPKPRSTGRTSEHFKAYKLNEHLMDRVDLITPRGKRIAAGTSIAPIPPISADRFGIIQEKLWDDPFWLLVAVVFLNQTTGRAAVPVFWALKDRFRSPSALAAAPQDDIRALIQHLGLQNQRSRTIIQIAQAWLADPPMAGRRYRTLHYPRHGDGRACDVPSVVEADAADCAGALEIAHLPGCGAYAYDSWRIFCRDVLRGVAADYRGMNAQRDAQDGFAPEWQRVVPADKELRACLRWMWLREGWIWDPLTGDKRRATADEMARAEHGETEIADPSERKFAAKAAARLDLCPGPEQLQLADTGVVSLRTEDEATPLQDLDEQGMNEINPALQTPTPAPRPVTILADDSDGDNIVVMTPARKAKLVDEPVSPKSKKKPSRKSESRVKPKAEERKRKTQNDRRRTK